MEQSLFHKYGGFAKISKIVLALYDRVLEDDQIGPFFDDVDMARVVDHQTKFVASLLGGPVAYQDDQIRAMHRHLPIHPEHFDKLKAILADTLHDHDIAPDDVDLVVQEFERRRRLVVG